MAKEKTLYEDEMVAVTTARAVLADTTYALANVTSVRAWTVPKSPWPLVFGGVATLASGTVLVRGGDPLAVLVLGAAGITGLLLFVLRKSQHYVRIGTAGAEVDAIVSPDRAYIEQIVAALNDAIARRG